MTRPTAPRPTQPDQPEHISISAWRKMEADTPTHSGRRDMEHRAQVELFRRIDEQARVDSRYELIYAVPNASAENARLGAEKKREGVRAGVPDICIASPVRRADGSWWPGAYIELKVKPNTCSAKQVCWGVRLRAAGYWYRLVREGTAQELADAAWLAVGEYLDGEA
jgi:hypothetical protein